MSFLKAITTAGLLAVAISTAAFGGTAPAPVDRALESVVTMQVDGTVTIDPLGQVAEFKTLAPLNEELRGKLDMAVLKWRFKPIIINGVAQRVTLNIRVVLRAAEVDGRFQVSVGNVLFPHNPKFEALLAAGSKPEISAGKLTPPKYPGGLMRANVSGMVLLGIRVGHDGRAAEVTAVQSMIYDVKGKDQVLRDAIGQMEDSALAAARRWTFKVPAERAHDNVADMTVSVPVEYVMGRKRPVGAGKWRTVVQLAPQQLPWMPKKPDQQQIGVADVQPGEVMSSDSPVKLTTYVKGAVLM